MWGESEVTCEAPDRALSTGTCLRPIPQPSAVPGGLGRGTLLPLPSVYVAPQPSNLGFSSSFRSVVLSGPLSFVSAFMHVLTHSAVRGPCARLFADGSEVLGARELPGGCAPPIVHWGHSGTHRRVCVWNTGPWGVGGGNTHHLVLDSGSVAITSPQQAAGKRFLLLSSL